MPTARGWGVAAMGAGTAVTGRILGSLPLEQLGAGLFLLVVVAALVVRRRTHELDVERVLRPARVPAGATVDVHLTLTNKGKGPAPLLLVEDRVPRPLVAPARFVVPGIEPEGARRASYVVSVDRRGLYRIGPARVSRLDPFGLARVTAEIGGEATLLVRPRVEPLPVPHGRGQRRSATSSAQRHPVGTTGEEFYTLRDYVEGDDLRKVHWPSTAKKGRFMLRQEETPWQTRAAILVDDRRMPHGASGGVSSFERCVEAAASLCDLYARAGYSWKLATSTGALLPLGRGDAHLQRSLDLLATIRLRDEPGDLGGGLAELDAGRSGETIAAVVTGTLTVELSLLLGRMSGHLSEVVVVSFPAHRFGDRATKARWEGEREIVEAAQRLARAGGRVMVLGPDDRLAAQWDARAQRGETWGRKPAHA